MRAHLDDADLSAAARYERRFRHDVMAHIHAFGDQAPAARPYLHLGATSAFVTDNADLVVMREGLRLLLGRLVAVLCLWRDSPGARRAALSRLHPLPAGPAHHGRKARHPVDAGPRARRGRTFSSHSRASVSRMSGYHRNPGCLPGALCRRRREGAGAGAPGHRQAGVRRAVRCHRTDLSPQGRQYGARRAQWDRAISRQDGRRPPAAPARGRVAGAVRVRAGGLQCHGLQAKSHAGRTHHRTRPLRHLAAGQWSAYRGESMAGANPGRQRQPAAHPAGGLPGRRCHSGAGDQCRSGIWRCGRKSSPVTSRSRCPSWPPSAG